MKTATFTHTPYNAILVRVIDRGYPREALIPPADLVPLVVAATRAGYSVIDRTHDNTKSGTPARVPDHNQMPTRKVVR